LVSGTTAKVKAIRCFYVYATDFHPRAFLENYFPYFSVFFHVSA
jgi:hypothetical protein